MGFRLISVGPIGRDSCIRMVAEASVIKGAGGSSGYIPFKPGLCSGYILNPKP